MTSLSQQIYNDGHSTGLTEGQAIGHAAGLTEGQAIGHAAGLTEGLTEGQANSVYALMQHQNYDSKTAMDILNIQEKDRHAVRRLLESKFLISVS